MLKSLSLLLLLLLTPYLLRYAIASYCTGQLWPPCALSASMSDDGVGPYIWPPEDLGDAQCFTSLLPLWATQMALETHQPASQRRVSATNPESTRFRHCLQALHTCDASATQKRKVCVPLRQIHRQPRAVAPTGSRKPSNHCGREFSDSVIAM